MAKSLNEIKKVLKGDGMHIFPDAPKVNNGKEYLSGYYRAKRGNAAQEQKAFAKRNAAAKFLRDHGFKTWTEPKSHMGGTDTCEFALSAMRVK